MGRTEGFASLCKSSRLNLGILLLCLVEAKISCVAFIDSNDS